MGPRRGAVMLVLALSASGCATLGWRYFPNTRSYNYQREVIVDVQSVPSGAAVYEDGKLIGTAPFQHRTRHHVKRVRKSRSGTGLVLGCIADSVIVGAAFYTWIDREAQFDTRGRLLFGSWLVPAIDCYFLGFMAGVEHATAGGNGELAEEPLWRHDKVSETTVPKTLTLEARWPDWSPVTTSIVVPERSLATLRRGHAGTFDDAIVRHARSGAPLSQEGLLRAGRAYRTMVGETKNPAHAKAAIDYFERFLNGEAGDRRPEVERAIAELRGLAGGN